VVVAVGLCTEKRSRNMGREGEEERKKDNNRVSVMERLREIEEESGGRWERVKDSEKIKRDRERGRE
jgi:hypothetical protein